MTKVFMSENGPASSQEHLKYREERTVGHPNHPLVKNSEILSEHKRLSKLK